MGNFNKRFGELLSEGLYSVSKRQGKTIAGVEEELAQIVQYSRPMLQKWRQGTHLPPTIKIVKQLTDYCQTYGRVDESWIESLIHQFGYPILPRVSPLELELPEGAMSPDSPYYIERETDQIARTFIEQTDGQTITITGSRQVGKSSLLMRVIDRAIKQSKKAVVLDFRLVNQTALNNSDLFFHQFCLWLTDELEQPIDELENYWRYPLGNSQRCTRYVSRYLLDKVDKPLILAIDNVDALFGASFQSDFFAMLRSWHDHRGNPMQPIWKRLDLILVTSTEPYQLVQCLNRSTFNVGYEVQLLDFTINQLDKLNRIYNSPFTSDQLQQLMDLIGGHPYLIRQAFHWVASRQGISAQLFDRAVEDNGPFGSHLLRHLSRLAELPEQRIAFKQIIEQNALIDESIFLRLQGAGLVRWEQDKILPRCRLYTDYFRKRLND